MKVPALLKNKYVCYAVMALAVVNVLGYVSERSYECLALFVASAYSIKCYSKNDTVGLLGGLFVANFLFGCGRVYEGFKEGTDEEEDKEEDEEEGEDENMPGEIAKQIKEMTGMMKK